VTFSGGSAGAVPAAIPTGQTISRSRSASCVANCSGPADFLVDLDDLGRRSSAQFRMDAAKPALGIGRFRVHRQDSVAGANAAQARAAEGLAESCADRILGLQADPRRRV
jgi:hypothetical protein